MESITKVIDAELFEEELKDWSVIAHGDSDGYILRMLSRFINAHGYLIMAEHEDIGGWIVNRNGDDYENVIHVDTRSEAYQVALGAIGYDKMYQEG